MTTQELKNKIEKVLGNNIRCLLPSYWWKNLFHSVADRINEVEQKIDEVEQKIDDVEIPDGIPIVNSEDALNRLDLPKGSVATVTTEGIKLDECYQPTEDEYNDLKSLYNKLTRIKTVEILYDKHPQNTQTMVCLIEQDYSNNIIYITVEGKQCTIRILLDGQIFYNHTTTSSSDAKLNEVLGQYDFRYLLAQGDGSTSSYDAFIVNGTSDVYTKGAGWERLAKLGDIPDEDEANGTIVFYQYPELPDEARQLNVEAYNKVSNAIARGKFDFDIKIYNDGRVVNPTFISGTLGIIILIAEAEGYRYMFQCFESGSVTVETEPISGGGGTSGDITIDTEMSDTSTNAVQNKVVKKYVDDAIANAEIGGGETDTSNFATKDELTNLTNEVITNEEVHAAALNDLNERKADKEYVEDALKNIDTSGLATKEELNAVIDRIDDIESSQLGAVTVEQETLIFKIFSSAKIVDNTLIL